MTTTLRDGTIVDESIDAVHFTTPENCPTVFGFVREIDEIGIHHWGPLGQNFDTVVGYLASDNPRQSSAHAIVMARRVTTIVAPENAAWAAGNAEGNARAYHIELRPEATDDDYATAAAFIAFVREVQNKDLPLVPHNHWIQTECPGVWDLARLDAMARNGVSPATAPAPTPAPAPAPAPAPRPGFNPSVDIHWRVEPGDTLGKIQAYYNGPSVTQIAAYNGITNPDVITPGTDIFIPGPLVWIIEAPDTVRTIAAYYGLDADYLAHKNGLPNADSEIYIGNTFNIL